MSNPTIGKLCDANATKDAIHVAIAPVIAAKRLYPGEHVGFVGDDREHVTDDNPIGIVDPFLERHVEKGERFYMMLYPNTVSGMRHEWTHPAFSAPITKENADERIESFAKTLQMSRKELMQAAILFQSTGDFQSGAIPTSSDLDYAGFWKDYETVTGTTVERDGSPFWDDETERCPC